MRVLPLLFLLVLPGCRDFAVDSGQDIPGRRFRSFDVQPHQPFEMAVGDEAYLTVADLTITLSMVLEDTRCPVGATCETPGYAGVLIDLSRGIGDESQIVLQIPGDVPIPYRQNDYVQQGQERFQLLSLKPYPRTDVERGQEPYVAEIVVDR